MTVGVRHVVKRAPVSRLVAAKRAVRALHLPRVCVRATPLIIPIKEEDFYVASVEQFGGAEAISNIDKKSG